MINIRPYAKRYAVKYKSNGARFTTRELVMELIGCAGMPTGDSAYHVLEPDGSREWVQTSPIKYLRNEVNHALNSIKDKEEHRIFYHDTKRVPTYFHRDHCTIEEGMCFYRYLKKQAKAADDEAEHVLRYIQRRARRERRLVA